MGEAKDFLEKKLGNIETSLSKKEIAQIRKAAMDIVIESEDLDNEVKTNPALYEYVSRLYNRAKAKRDQLDIKLSQLRAAVLLDYRKDFGAGGRGKGSPTVAEIGALVDLHEDVVALQDEVLAANLEMNDLFGMRETISKRGSMLKLLAEELDRVLQFKQG